MRQKSVLLVGGPANGKLVIVQSGTYRLVVPVLRNPRLSFTDHPSFVFDQIVYAPRNEIMRRVGVWEVEQAK